MITMLRQHGLSVTDLDGFKTHVPGDALQLTEHLNARLFDQACTVLLCVKGGATSGAAQELAAVCPPDTPVISLQNGVDNADRIRAEAPLLRVVAGMVPFNVVMLPKGHVHRVTTGALHMAQQTETQALAPAWNAAGLPLELTDDMQSVQWGKLLLNLNNPVNALSDLPLRTQLMDRDYRYVVASLQTEALQALKAAGIRPAKVATAPPLWLPFILRLPNAIFTRVAARMLRMDAAARSSMWEDFQQGRVTEIDDLCGAVVRMAQAHGTQAPANAAMCRLISSHQPGQSMSGTELRAALGT
jgi:2-dehydropantoate 2-reductase